MSDSEDYYATLGISKSATDDEIKRAYRKLAMKWHPDKNQGSAEAEEKFKKIAEAYEALSDPQRRKSYDMFGKSGLQGGMPSGGTTAGGSGFPGGGNTFFFTSGGPGGGGFSDPREVFAKFFSSMGRMGGMGMGMDDGDDDGDFASFFGPGMMSMSSRMGGRPIGTSGKKTAQKPEPTIFPLSLTLEEMFTGCTKKLKITRKRLANPKDRNSLTESSKVIEVECKPTYKEGTRLTWESEGDQDPTSGLYSDIVVILKQKDHPIYTRAGNDVVMKKNITLTEALCGYKNTFASLDGSKIELDTTGTVISPENNRKHIWGKGFQSKNGPGSFRIDFNIVFPKQVSTPQKQLLQQAGL